METGNEMGRGRKMYIGQMYRALKSEDGDQNVEVGEEQRLNPATGNLGFDRQVEAAEHQHKSRGELGERRRPAPSLGTMRRGNGDTRLGTGLSTPRGCLCPDERQGLGYQITPISPSQHRLLRLPPCQLSYPWDKGAGDRGGSQTGTCPGPRCFHLPPAGLGSGDNSCPER